MHFACRMRASWCFEQIDNCMKLRRLRNNIFLSARRIAMMSLALTALAAPGTAARAEDPEIASRRAAERHEFTDGEIKDGFFKIAFRAELQIGRKSERIRKFDEPVRIFIDSKAQPDRSAEIIEIVADIRRHIDHLDVAVTDNRVEANFTVSLVAGRRMTATIRARYGKGRARQIERSLNPQCLSGIGKDAQFRIRRAEALLPADADDFTFYDCAYEELLQGLGAINDDASVPWTMFNDDVQMGFFDVYDQYLLNILYDPRIRAGMTRADVTRLLPDVLQSTRARIRTTDTTHHASTPDANPVQTVNQSAVGSSTN
jgi:hypothetical protein